MIFLLLMGAVTLALTWIALKNHRLNRAVITTFLDHYDEPCPAGRPDHGNPQVFTQARRRIQVVWLGYGVAMILLLGVAVWWYASPRVPMRQVRDVLRCEVNLHTLEKRCFLTPDIPQPQEGF